MSTLDSASTTQQVLDAYDDNASWREDLNVAKARAFVTACRILMRRRPTEARHGSQLWKFDPQDLRNEISEAEKFIARNSSSRRKSVLHPDLRNLRD